MQIVWSSNPEVIRFWLRKDWWDRFIKKSGTDEQEFLYQLLNACKGDGKWWFGVLYDDKQLKGLMLAESKIDELIVHALVGENLKEILNALERDDFANSFARIIFFSKRKGWLRYNMKKIANMWEWSNVEVRN